MKKLTVALATFNEEKNLGSCLESIKDIADEIVIVDGTSSDKTVDVAKKFGARILVVPNQQIFHINKQKALEMSHNEWVLQLDADEIVSPELAKEIMEVIIMDEHSLDAYQAKIPNRELFLRHQKLLEGRDGSIGTKTGEYAAFFIPRLNFFLGRYLRYGGVYPDGVIRLVKRSKSKFPCKDVHEQIEVNGRVGWLQHDLIHMADPTFARYIARNKRYIAVLATQIHPKGFLDGIDYLLIKPVWWFGLTFIRHKGILDGWQGFVFSFFSALRFPRAYLLYMQKKA